MNTYYTEYGCCQSALDVQDACNIGGVSNSFHIVLISLREKYGWEYPLGQHPAVVLFHDKLEDMLRLDYEQRASFESFSKAYDECERIVGHKQPLAGSAEKK